MASHVCASLGLGGPQLLGKLVQVDERHGSEAGFVLCSAMWAAGQAGASLCVVALHHSRAHLQHVARRLGLDLKSATVLEPLIMYGRVDSLDMAADDNIRRLYADVKAALAALPPPKCLVIDDLSDLLCMGAGLRQAIMFLQGCRALVDDSVCLVVGTHRSHDSSQLAAAVAHMADRRVEVTPLATGFSPAVTGSLKVDGRTFHYKLTDRQVRVFAPGTNL